MGRNAFLGFCLLVCLTLTSLVEGSVNVKLRVRCPEEAVYYRNHCYQLIDLALSWEAAEIECQQLRSGGHLASFRTAKEENVVSSHIRRYSSTTDAWIGLHATPTSKQKLIWEWSDGTTNLPGSILWDNRAPSPSFSAAECISLTNIQNQRNSVRWVQRTCATTLPFICKFRATF